MAARARADCAHRRKVDADTEAARGRDVDHRVAGRPLLDTVLAATGLTGDEFAIYSVLNAAPDITPTELARWMASPPTTVSSYLRRFESRGHVSRKPNPADRRSYRIRLTAAGRRAHKAAAGRFTPMLGAVTTALGGQESEVREALLRLRTIVDRLRQGSIEDDHGSRSRR